MFWRGEVYSGRAVYILGAPHIVVEKGIYSGRKLYSRAASLYIKLGYILGGRGRLWDC